MTFVNKKLLIFAASKHDYPVNLLTCKEFRGEQALIDTTPFKSYLRVAFLFFISFLEYSVVARMESFESVNGNKFLALNYKHF